MGARRSGDRQAEANLDSGSARQCRAAIRLRKYSSCESDGLEWGQFIPKFYPPRCGYCYYPRPCPDGGEGSRRASPFGSRSAAQSGGGASSGTETATVSGGGPTESRRGEAKTNRAG